jgi:hypothetical protein
MQVGSLDGVGLGGQSGPVGSTDIPADRPTPLPAAPAVMVKPTYITWLTLAFMTPR